MSDEYIARSLVVNASFNAKDIVIYDGSVNGGAFSSGDANNGGLVEGRRNGATNCTQKSLKTIESYFVIASFFFYYLE